MIESQLEEWLCQRVEALCDQPGCISLAILAAELEFQGFAQLLPLDDLGAQPLQLVAFDALEVEDKVPEFPPVVLADVVLEQEQQVTSELCLGDLVHRPQYLEARRPVQAGRARARASADLKLLVLADEDGALGQVRIGYPHALGEAAVGPQARLDCEWCTLTWIVPVGLAPAVDTGHAKQEVDRDLTSAVGHAARVFVAGYAIDLLPLVHVDLSLRRVAQRRDRRRLWWLLPNPLVVLKVRDRGRKVQRKTLGGLLGSRKRIEVGAKRTHFHHAFPAWQRCATRPAASWVCNRPMRGRIRGDRRRRACRNGEPQGRAGGRAHEDVARNSTQ